MKTKFSTPVKLQNIFDGGLYMFGRDGKSFVGLALCRAKREFVVSLSPSPGNKSAPGLDPLKGLYEDASYLSDLDLELFLSPRDVLLDSKAPARAGEMIVIGEHHYLCFADGEGGLGFVTFGTGQVQAELPEGARNRYRSWQVVRPVLGEREVLARFPYRNANLEILPEPEERRREDKPVSTERRRNYSKSASFGERRKQLVEATPAMPATKAGD